MPDKIFISSPHCWGHDKVQISSGADVLPDILGMISHKIYCGVMPPERN